jgi:hypothetical protein
MKKLLQIGCVVLVALSSAQATYVLNDNVKEAYLNIYSLHLDAADSLIQQEAQVNPKNDFISYLRFNLGFTKIFISEDEAVYLELEKAMNSYVNRIKSSNESSPWRGTCLSEMYMLRSALKLKFGRGVKSGFDGIKAYNFAEETKENHPDFKPCWLNWGLINVAVGSVPDSYKGLVSALGFDGDIEQGMNFIEESWKDSQLEGNEFLSPKSTLIYGYTSLQLNQNRMTSLKDLNLKEDYRQNNLLVYLESKFLQTKRDNAALIELLEQRDRSKAVYPIYYLYFVEGKAKTSALLDSADVPFNYYLEHYQGNNFIKSTHFRLAAYFYLKGDLKKSDFHKSQIQTKGYLFTGADKMAESMANRDFNYNLLLAQAHFDNGLYDSALVALTNPAIYCVTNTDSVEMYYRLGRVYEAQGNDIDAIGSFKKAIETSDERSTYYLANSAMQLALILERKKMNASARYYLKLTLSFKDYPFQDGIQQQAKAVTKRVEKKK